MKMLFYSLMKKMEQEVNETKHLNDD